MMEDLLSDEQWMGFAYEAIEEQVGLACALYESLHERLHDSDAAASLTEVLLEKVIFQANVRTVLARAAEAKPHPEMDVPPAKDSEWNINLN